MQKVFSNSNIDSDGFRANVGIILTNDHGKLFWAKRVGMDAWQFPQGGIRPNEDIKVAMYRELHEEIGLLPDHVEIMGHTNGWLKYRLPQQYIRKNSRPLCRGQKQKWYLLRFIGNENAVRLDVSNEPEFDNWCWINYWEPITKVISFKRGVYEQALVEFEDLLINTGIQVALR